MVRRSARTRAVDVYLIQSRKVVVKLDPTEPLATAERSARLVAASCDCGYGCGEWRDKGPYDE